MSHNRTGVPIAPAFGAMGWISRRPAPSAAEATPALISTFANGQDVNKVYGVRLNTTPPPTDIAKASALDTAGDSFKVKWQ